MKIHGDLLNKSGIETYPGYLPKLIRISLLDEKREMWYDSIEQLDSYPEIIGKIQFSKHMCITEDELIKELEDWIVENPKYSFLFEY